MLAAILTTETLWRNALAAIPVACVVALLCRWLPCRPSTRHLLWLVVLLVLLAPPGVPRLRPGAMLGFGAKQGEPVGTALAEAPAAATPEALDIVELPAAEPPPASALIEWLRPAPIAELARVPEPAATDADIAELGEFLAAALTGPPAPEPDRVLATVPAEATPAPRTMEPPALAAAPRSLRPSAIVPPAPPLSDAAAPRITASSAAAPAAPTVAAPIPAATPKTAQTSLWASMPESVKQWWRRMVDLRDAVAALPALPMPVWAGGSALIVLISALRLLRHRRMLRTAEPAPADVAAMVAAAAAALGLRRAPRAYMVPDRLSPMVWCGRTPRLILPKELWAELDAAGRGAVIHHELAHLRRRDHWVCWAEMAASLLYWWHPVVWWVRRRLRDEADLCCDAWVTTLFPSHRRAYAQALLETRRFISESRQSPPALGLGATTNRARHFARRLTMVMTQRSTPRRSIPGMMLAAGLCAAGVLSAPLLACPPEDEKSSTTVKSGGRTTITSPRPAQVARPAQPPREPRAPRAARAPQPPAAAMAPTPAVPPAPPAPPAPPSGWIAGGGGGEGQSTYEEHMNQRRRGASAGGGRGGLSAPTPGYAPSPMAQPAIPGVPGTPGTPGVPGMASQGGFYTPGRAVPGQAPAMAPSQNLERRMQQLERRMEEMNRRLERTLERLERMSEGPNALPQVLATTQPAGALLGTIASVEGGPQGRAIVILLGDDNQIKAYTLGDNKLEAITALVEGSGSPLVIQRGQLGEVARLAELNAVAGLRNRELALAEVARAQDAAALAEHAARSRNVEAMRELEAAQAHAHNQAAHAKAHELAAQEAYRAGRQAETARDMASLQERARAAEAHAAQHGRAQESRALLEALRASAKDRNTAAEKLRERAESMAERAEAMSERAEELAEKLAESREAAEELSGQAREAAVARQKSLEDAVRQLREAVTQLLEQANKLSEQADDLSDQASELPDEVEESDDADEPAEPSEPDAGR